MSHNNRPVLTGTELLEYIASLVGANSSDATVARATKNTLLSFGHRLKNCFYLVLPVAPRSKSLNLSEFGVDNVTDVSWSCNEHGNFMPVNDWRIKDHILTVDAAHSCGTMWLKLEHWQNPALIDATATLAAEFSYPSEGGGEVNVSITNTSQIPFAGYVKVGTAPDGEWYEYQATYYGEDPETGVHLMLSKRQPWVHQTGVAAVGEPVVWGIGFPTSLLLSATGTQAASYYWAAKTGQCNSDEERDTAMQLMNYWSGEAEKAWRNAPTSAQPRLNRERQPGELSWLYQ